MNGDCPPNLPNLRPSPPNPESTFRFKDKLFRDVSLKRKLGQYLSGSYRVIVERKYSLSGVRTTMYCYGPGGT